MVSGGRQQAPLRRHGVGVWWPRRAEVQGLDSEGSQEPWKADEGHGQTCTEEQVLSVGVGTGGRRPAELLCWSRWGRPEQGCPHLVLYL